MALDSRVSSGNPKEDDDRVDAEVERLVKLYGFRACRRSLDKLQERDEEEEAEEAHITTINVAERKQQGVKEEEKKSRNIHVVDHTPREDGEEEVDEDQEQEGRSRIREKEDEEARTSTTTIEEVVHRKQQQQQKGFLQEHRRDALIGINTAIMNASADAICVVDARGTIRRANNAAETGLAHYLLPGTTEQQGLVGRNIFQRVRLVRRDHQEQGPGAHHQQAALLEQPFDMDRSIDDIFQEQIRQGKNWREVSARRNDGTEYPALLRLERIGVDNVAATMTTTTSKDDGHTTTDTTTATPKNCHNEGVDEDHQHDLYVTVIRDCSEKKMAEEKLACQCALSEKLKTALLDASPDAIFAVCPMVGTILSVNRAGIKMFGYDNDNGGGGGRREISEELIGQRIETVLGAGCVGLFGVEHPVAEQPTLLGGISAAAAAAAAAHDGGAGRNKQRELVCRRRNGSQFPAVVGVQRVEPFLFAFIRDATEEQRARELEVSARSADELLHNLLPDEIIDRLKADPSHLAEQHDNAPVLFADIVGFTAMSSKMKPLELVRVLNDLFTRFDGLVEDYRLNKVKTIGDCYMVTSIPCRSDPVKACRAMCHFALDMLEALQEFNTEQQQQQNSDAWSIGEQQQHQPLGLRVGINCGTVVAGVVGTNRFLYDLWGDAVNVASRMESTGIPLRIQVTKAVVDQVPKGEFEFNERGPIDVKGKGTMETYFLEKPVRKGNRDLLRQALQENFEPVSPSSLLKRNELQRLASGPRNLMSLLLGSSQRRPPPSELSPTAVNFFSTGTAVPSPPPKPLALLGEQPPQPLMRFASTGTGNLVECSESFKDFMAIMNGGKSCSGNNIADQLEDLEDLEPTN